MQFFIHIFLSILALVNTANAVILGVESITPFFLEQQGIKKDACIGIVANQTSKTSNKQSSVGFLVKKGFNITHIFAPEHGYDGKTLAEKGVRDTIDSLTRIPIISLYRENGPKIIDPKLLATIDCIFFDLQDVGMRHYTYISTLYKLMESALTASKPIIVLDRPNPQGSSMEGPLVQKGFESFISIAPIPLKHGMTAGELATYFNTYFFNKKVKLFVVPMKNYNRSSQNFKMLAPLSPNIKSQQAIWGYSFLGLLGEVQPFDVGVGTKHAFVMIALPEKILSTAGWKNIEPLLSLHAIKTKSLKYHKKEKKQRFEGLLLEITDPEKIRTNFLFESILKVCFDEKIKTQFMPNFDKAFGTPLFRSSFLSGKKYKSDEQSLKAFYKRAQSIFLYEPWPSLV